MWTLPAHYGVETQLTETTWYGPHPTRRFTRVFPAIGPLEDLS
jgi:hypothetical protein